MIKAPLRPSSGPTVMLPKSAWQLQRSEQATGKVPVSATKNVCAGPAKYQIVLRLPKGAYAADHHLVGLRQERASLSAQDEKTAIGRELSRR
jgi:hypothetical protein